MVTSLALPVSAQHDDIGRPVDASTFNAPFYLLNDSGSEVPLEMIKPAKGRSFFSLEGEHSLVRFSRTSNFRFGFRLPRGILVTGYDLRLGRYKSKDGLRVLEKDSSFANSQLDRAPEMTFIPIRGGSGTTFSPGTFLVPGEYCLGLGKDPSVAYCFGVDQATEKDYDLAEWKDTKFNHVWKLKDNGYDLSWDDALQYCLAANLKDHRGMGAGWRMPTLAELQSLGDPKMPYGIRGGITIAPERRNDVSKDQYLWSQDLIEETQDFHYRYMATLAYSRMAEGGNGYLSGSQISFVTDRMRVLCVRSFSDSDEAVPTSGAKAVDGFIYNPGLPVESREFSGTIEEFSSALPSILLHALKDRGLPPHSYDKEGSYVIEAINNCPNMNPEVRHTVETSGRTDDTARDFFSKYRACLSNDFTSLVGRYDHAVQRGLIFAYTVMPNNSGPRWQNMTVFLAFSNLASDSPKTLDSHLIVKATLHRSK